MISYRYNHQMSPPAPFVHVTLRHPDGSKQVDLVPAQLDTAADRTAIPDALAAGLGLVHIRDLPLGGFGGHRTTVPTYFVELSVHNFPFRDREVCAIGGEPYVILGRDVLNDHRIVLDGPTLSLDIDLPPAPGSSPAKP